ncbi:MAG TPA: alpha/beta hydrolase [Nitrososphaerales archaeon]|nr:alpha/beta hydrolase [Nitrososphaerales archaeon]
MQASERLVELGEFTVNCASSGKGEGLVMLHGSDHRESWRVFEPLMQLSDSFNVVALDLVGYGRSSRPLETPDHRVQAQVLKDLVEKLSLGKTNVLGAGWGGQVALEFALQWPDSAKSLVLVSSAYDKSQLPRLEKLRKPALIVYAEDDMITQQKAGYTLRDAIGTSRLEILEPVAHDPRQDFTISHRLQQFRPGQLMQLVRRFLADPGSMLAEPPEMENELRGMALRKDSGGA